MNIDFCNLSGWYINNDRATTLPSVNSTIDLSYLQAVVITQPVWSKMDKCFVRNELTKDLSGPASVKGKYITFQGNTSKDSSPLAFHMGSINCESGLRLIGAGIYAQGKSRPNIQVTVSNASTGTGLYIENRSIVAPYKDKSITGIANISTKFCRVDASELDEDINISCENIHFTNQSTNQANINGKSQFVFSMNKGKLSNDTVFINSTNDYKGIISAPSAIMTDSSQNFGLITAGSTFFLGGSLNLGRIKSKTTFQGSSCSNHGICSGTTLFYNSSNVGLVVEEALFSGALAFNTSAVVSGQNIKFISNATNAGYLSGNQILFSGNASNASQTITIADADLIYTDYSTNTSDVSGANIIFALNSTNYGVARSSQKIIFSNLSENYNDCYCPYIVFDNGANKGDVVAKEFEFINQSSNISTIGCEKVIFGSGSINTGFISNIVNDEKTSVTFEKAINAGGIGLNGSGGVVLFKESRSNIGVSISSNEIIFEKSNNYGSLYSSTLTELREKSQNYGTINGLVKFSSRSSNTSLGEVYNAIFTSQSVNHGTVQFEGVFSGTINFGLVMQAGRFFVNGVNSGLLDNFGSFVASRNHGLIAGVAVFSGGGLNYGTCQSYASFIDGSTNRGYIASEALFRNNSVNDHVVHAGASLIHNCINSISGYINDFCLLQSGSINYGIIDGGANLFNACINKGYINSSAYFLDSDNAAGGVVFGNNVVFDHSTNQNEGTISGDVSFINNSLNYGLVVGTAFFDESSYNYGIVSGTCSGPGCP